MPGGRDMKDGNTHGVKEGQMTRIKDKKWSKLRQQREP
jgi:hypothetical protein